MRDLRPYLERVKIETYQITARYDLSIKELIKIAKLNDYFTNNPYHIQIRHFPKEKQPREKKKEAILLHHGFWGSEEETLAIIKHLRCRGGTIKELLSFAIDYPRKQKKFPIIATGSIWKRERHEWYTPVLDYANNERGLSLYWTNSEWYGWCSERRWLVFCLDCES